MFSTRKRRDFVTQPKEKFTIQSKHEVFGLPFPEKTSLDSSFQFHFHFLVLSLRFPGDGGTFLWSLSVIACYCTVTAGMTILYGACVSMERCFFGRPISECCESAGVKWDYLPLKKYPHHFLCKDQQSQNLHETGRSSEHDLKRNSYLKKK